jgi:VWFA-related protein
MVVVAEASGQNTTTFRAGVDLVALNVVVTDQQQEPVSGLTATDFTVLEDGVRQEVAFFAATDIPIDLALLLDTSGSMSEKMGIVQQAAKKFVDTLRPGDRVMVVDIKGATKVLYGLGPDLRAAGAAIEGTTSGGSTGLYTGLYSTLSWLAKANRSGEVRRQALVVLSDGLDTASLIAFEDVMDAVKRSDVAIYTITVRTRFGSATRRSAQASSPSEFAMKTLAQETGARAFFPQAIEEISTIYGSIAKELSNQYALGYIPKNDVRDGAFRRIVVQIPDRPGARTRTRSGYLSSRPASRTASE